MMDSYLPLISIIPIWDFERFIANVIIEDMSSKGDQSINYVANAVTVQEVPPMIINSIFMQIMDRDPSSHSIRINI